MLTSGNIGIDSISVSFCDNWKQLGDVGFWATFFKDESEKLKVKLDNGECKIPNEMLIEKGAFYFGVYAENANYEEVKTSSIVKYYVGQGTATTGETVSKIVANAQEEYRAELANSLETATGEDYTGQTWEELNEEVQSMNNHEVTIDLSEYVKYDEMPEIDVDEVVSEVSGSVNIYPAFSADKWTDNTIYTGGDIIFSDEEYCHSPIIKVKPNTQYAATVCPYSIKTLVGLDIIPHGDIDLNTGKETTLFATPTNCDGIVITIAKENFGGTTDIDTAVENFNSVFMLVEGNTLPTEFVPYEKGGYRLNENVEVPAIGDKSKLKTENKNSLVDAINELVENPTFGTESVPDGGGTFPVEKTKLSEFENDVGYITAGDVPNVPTKTSELENDSGFVTTQELDELSDEIDVERARITNLATLSEGSTTGDAELIDARVGYDGTIYDNVGDAVRNQVSNITEMFAFETSSNLFNFETATANKKLDMYTGELTVDDHNNFYVSDFIPTEYGNSYIGTVWLNDTEYPTWAGSKVVFYDENKQYLGISSTGLNNGVTISKNNAKYFRAIFQCTYGTKKVYLGEGTTKPETFIPYVNKKVIKDEHLSITDDTVIADHTISSIKLKDLEEHKLVPFELAENLYNYENRIDGKQYRNGELIDNENGCVSEKIPAEPNAVYTVGVLWRDAWYYSATLFAYCFDENNKWLGQVYTTDGVFTTLEKTKFISFFINYGAVPEHYKQACLVKGDKLPTAFVPYSGKLYRLNPDYISSVMKYISSWKDKKFVSYGDSITQQNLWQPYVRNYFEMEHACRGVGGSGFVRGVSHYYANADGSYNSKYTTGSTAPEGTTLCEACLCSDERIALSIPEDADLILIAGGTNDHGGDATSVPELGEISYTIVDGKPVFDTTTFKNAVCATVYKIMERCPEAIVMLMTPCNTRGMNQVQTVNGNGLELLDYAHAIKECAEYMSIPCIDVYGESGLNQFNMKLNGDNLHPDDAGARKMARAVIAKLKAYEPRKTVFGW